MGFALRCFWNDLPLTFGSVFGGIRPQGQGVGVSRNQAVDQNPSPSTVAASLINGVDQQYTPA